MRLLIYEPSYRRLAGSISSEVEPVLMSDAGELTLAGRAVTVEDAGVEAGWMNADLWAGGPGREYAVALLKSPKLRWVQSGAAGFDNPVFGKLIEKGVTLTTSHGQAVGMAEYVLWGVLDHFQRGAERRASQANRAWNRLAFREITGSHWLVIGFGAIGQGVAQRARAFGARVTGVRRSQAPHPDADAIAALSDLPRLLPQADVVVLSIPLTAESRHLVDARFLSAMKDGSVLVNVGRGGLVDEPALLAVLDAGKPEHALLDVFETEPLPPENPFWDHPRVMLTPHASGITSGQGTRNDALFLENLGRFVRGGPLLNAADPRDVLAGR
ncbi:D-2-hydroxyacid dehydrogenase [Phenylobacterium sp.]|uniref:D-2-hydroxyacid dehydrogenase n=1 Tax=Phenylobacterium sp. TaxID=1871053 RepID=UPI002CCC003B|nr:D-2-hydroxyacid dehydrogenase [Phenylobacterium sp.]HVI31935.1 D-2-hydroxyacid dehydrogenase [Phenylobacterium sp.]